MKNYNITFTEDINLATIRDVNLQRKRIFKLLEENDIGIVTCCAKPSGATDLLISVPNTKISKAASLFKDATLFGGAMIIRSGICRIYITSEDDFQSNIISTITKYFDKKQIDIERVIFSDNEIQLFFPALEVCGSLNAFMTDFKNFLLSQ